MKEQAISESRQTQEQTTTPLPTRARHLLFRRRWVGAAELTEALGHRFSAALYVVRHGQDGQPPLDLLTRRDPETGEWQWRWSGKYRDVGVKRRLCDRCHEEIVRSKGTFLKR